MLVECSKCETGEGHAGGECLACGAHIDDRVEDGRPPSEIFLAVEELQHERALKWAKEHGLTLKQFRAWYYGRQTVVDGLPYALPNSRKV